MIKLRTPESSCGHPSIARTLGRFKGCQPVRYEVHECNVCGAWASSLQDISHRDSITADADTKVTHPPVTARRYA
jgi:hypothetical protein